VGAVEREDTVMPILASEPYLSLVGAVIDPTMRGFAGWLQGPCGRFWCEVGGLDPEVVFQTFWKIRGVDPLPIYEIRERCLICHRKTIDESQK